MVTLNPQYIESVLKKNSFIVDYVNGVDTGGIKIHRFKIQNHYGDSEIIAVKHVKLFGNIQIEAENGRRILDADEFSKLEKTIEDAIALTPENRMEHLFFPLLFITTNSFSARFDPKNDNFENLFFEAVSPMNKRLDEDVLCFLTFSMLETKHTPFILNLFTKMESLHSVIRHPKTKTICLKFYKFTENLHEEPYIIKKVKDALNRIGIPLSVSDLLDFSD